MNFDPRGAFEKVYGKLEGWLETLIAMIPNFALAVILIILFFVIGKIIKNLFRKLIARATDNLALQDLFSSIVYITILAFGFFVVLDILKLDRTVTSLLAGIGVIGIALGFALQEIVSNLFSGVILAFKTPFSIGQVVELNGIFGVVQRSSLRVTIIKTLQGQEVHIPNKLVMQNAIYNYSATGVRRIDLKARVSYLDDLEFVQEIVVKAIKTHVKGLVPEREVEVFYEEFDESSINFLVRFWIPFSTRNKQYYDQQSMAIVAIRNAFKENGITIPYPRHSVDINDPKFQDKGENRPPIV